MKKIVLAMATAAVFALSNVSAAYALGYGQGTTKDSSNRPVDAVRFNEENAKNGVFSLSSDPNQIIITFDQGYENGYTAPILDTLKEKGVKAIFFLTGDYAKAEPALVQRMIDEGHMLGNHGMKHKALPTLSAEGIKEELMSLHQYVLDEFGYEMQYFRCPCGEYSDDSLAVVSQLGYKTVFWSFAYVDWMTDSQPLPGDGLRKIQESAHGGEILLLHSVSSTNAQILGEVIDNFRAMGYTL